MSKSGEWVARSWEIDMAEHHAKAQARAEYRARRIAQVEYLARIESATWDACNEREALIRDMVQA